MLPEQIVAGVLVSCLTLHLSVNVWNLMKTRQNRRKRQSASNTKHPESPTFALAAVGMMLFWLESFLYLILVFSGLFRFSFVSFAVRISLRLLGASLRNHSYSSRLPPILMECDRQEEICHLVEYDRTPQAGHLGTIPLRATSILSGVFPHDLWSAVYVAEFAGGSMPSSGSRLFPSGGQGGEDAYCNIWGAVSAISEENGEILATATT